jgi:putative tricarboxylic transport membrane protein
MSRKLSAFCATALGLIATTAPAYAQFQPTRPIEIVAHNGPGSGNDAFARTLAALFEQEKLVPVRVQVVNKPGGGSTTASVYLASKSGDAHTLGVYTNTWLIDHLVQQAAQVSLYQNLTPVARVVIEPGLFVVRADAPWKSLKEFIEAAKANPGKLKQSGGSITARENIVRQLLAKQTGANWSFISFPSGSERMAALLGGHVNLMMIDPGEGIEQVRAGKLKVLAQLADTRLAAFKDVPTVKESGYDLPSIPQVRGVIGPPNMPADALAYYEGVFRKLSETAGWKKYIADNYFEDGFMPGAQSKKFLAEFEADLRVQLQTTGAKIVR